MSKAHATTCRYAYTPKGKINRKHVCRPSCSWSGQECLDWCNRTPYPGQALPPAQIVHLDCPCGRSYSDHFETVCEGDGMIKALRFSPCRYNASPWRAVRRVDQGDVAA